MIPTNAMALLVAEIDSAGSLRLAGDRVLFGKRSKVRTESEWLVRQKVTQCRHIIAEVVHRYGGIISRTDGDQVFCHLLDATSAFEAACAIQHAIAPRAGGETDMTSATVVTQMGVRIAVHFGPLMVDGGDITGPNMTRLRALLAAAEPDQILASQAFVDGLPTAQRGLTTESDVVARDSDDSPLPTWQLNWKSARTRVRLPHLSSGSATDVSMEAHPPPPEVEDDLEATQAIRPVRPRKEAPGLVQRIVGAARPASTADLPATELRLRARGREVKLGPAQPTISLKGGRNRGAEHARIVLRTEGFVLENRDQTGTYVRTPDGAQQHCTSSLLLSGSGMISLGDASFDDRAQVLEYEIS